MERSHQQQYLDGLEFVRWVRRDPRDYPVEADLTLDLSLTEGALFELAAVVDQCKACSLHTGRDGIPCLVRAVLRLTVCLSGKRPAPRKIVVAVPFVGRAGQLLNAMIFALGVERDQTYIANVLKCRPPDNRDPQGVEVHSCETYLHRQIELIEPRLIIALGRFAAQSLLKSPLPIGKLRGVRHSYEPFGIPSGRNVPSRIPASVPIRKT